MQVVTIQIGERVQQLMDMPLEAAATGTSGQTPAATDPVAARSRAAVPPTSPAAPAAPAASVAAVPDRAAIEGQVAGALGEVAMLLNNVEVR